MVVGDRPPFVCGCRDDGFVSMHGEVEIQPLYFGDDIGIDERIGYCLHGFLESDDVGLMAAFVMTLRMTAANFENREFKKDEILVPVDACFRGDEEQWVVHTNAYKMKMCLFTEAFGVLMSMKWVVKRLLGHLNDGSELKRKITIMFFRGLCCVFEEDLCDEFLFLFLCWGRGDVSSIDE